MAKTVGTEVHSLHLGVSVKDCIEQEMTTS
jgi:hypothetical protein